MEVFPVIGKYVITRDAAENNGETFMKKGMFFYKVDYFIKENVENTKVDASIKENIETQNYTFMRGECLLPQG